MSRKLKWAICPLFFCALLFGACGNGTNSALNLTTHVYVFGNSRNDGDSVANCWIDKSAIPQKLSVPEGMAGSIVNCVTASGVNRYAAGEYYDEDDNHFPCYWKNEGDPVVIGDGYQGSVYSIVAEKNTIYILGNSDEDYWLWDSLTNNQTLLSPPVAGAVIYPQAIAVANGVVCAAGYYTSAGVSAACYWNANGDCTGLSVSGDYATYGFAAAALAGKVLMAGKYQEALVDNACCWDNLGGALTTLTAGGGRANAVTAANNRFYIAGYYRDGIDRACYWNGEGSAPVALPAAPTTTPRNSYAYSIAVSGSAVYAAGEFYDDDDNNVPCYWADDGFHSIYDAYEVTGIAVAKY